MTKKPWCKRSALKRLITTNLRWNWNWGSVLSANRWFTRFNIFFQCLGYYLHHFHKLSKQFLLYIRSYSVRKFHRNPSAAFRDILLRDTDTHAHVQTHACKLSRNRYTWRSKDLLCRCSVVVQVFHAGVSASADSVLPNLPDPTTADRAALSTRWRSPRQRWSPGSGRHCRPKLKPGKL